MEIKPTTFQLHRLQKEDPPRLSPAPQLPSPIDLKFIELQFPHSRHVEGCNLDPYQDGHNSCKHL